MCEIWRPIIELCLLHDLLTVGTPFLLIMAPKSKKSPSEEREEREALIQALVKRREAADYDSNKEPRAKPTEDNALKVLNW